MPSIVRHMMSNSSCYQLTDRSRLTVIHSNWSFWCLPVRRAVLRFPILLLHQPVFETIRPSTCRNMHRMDNCWLQPRAFGSVGCWNCQPFCRCVLSRSDDDQAHIRIYGLHKVGQYHELQRRRICHWCRFNDLYVGEQITDLSHALFVKSTNKAFELTIPHTQTDTHTHINIYIHTRKYELWGMS